MIPMIPMTDPLSMYDAQVLWAPSGATTILVYTPWFVREADNMLVTLEVSRVNSDFSDLVLDVFHRASAATGDGAQASGSLTLSAIGRDQQIWVGLLQFVRFRLTMVTSGGGGDGWAMYRILRPTWFDSVKA
jgi:hypothetical protein